MATIRVSRGEPSGAPGAFVVRQVGGPGEVLVQQDWEFAGIAESFGWRPCHCGETDGTVSCPHRSVEEMLDEARDFLEERANEGARAEDPGYFS